MPALGSITFRTRNLAETLPGSTHLVISRRLHATQVQCSSGHKSSATVTRLIHDVPSLRLECSSHRRHRSVAVRSSRGDRHRQSQAEPRLSSRDKKPVDTKGAEAILQALESVCLCALVLVQAIVAYQAYRDRTQSNRTAVQDAYPTSDPSARIASVPTQPQSRAVVVSAPPPAGPPPSSSIANLTLPLLVLAVALGSLLRRTRVWTPWAERSWTDGVQSRPAGGKERDATHFTLEQHSSRLSRLAHDSNRLGTRVRLHRREMKPRVRALEDAMAVQQELLVQADRKMRHLEREVAEAHNLIDALATTSAHQLSVLSGGMLKLQPPPHRRSGSVADAAAGKDRPDAGTPSGREPTDVGDNAGDAAAAAEPTAEAAAVPGSQGEAAPSVMEADRIELADPGPEVSTSAAEIAAEPLATVHALHRFAIKGLERDSLDSVQLARGHAFPYDRKWALKYEAPPSGAGGSAGGSAAAEFDPEAPGWLHKSAFLCAFTAIDKLAPFETRFDDARTLLTVRRKAGSGSGGEEGEGEGEGEAVGEDELAADLSTGAGRAAVEAFFSGPRFGGVPVRLVAAHRQSSQGAGEPSPTATHEHQFGNTRSGVRESGDTRTVHIISLSTVAALSRAVGSSVDPRRFRANIVLSGAAPAWEEFAWVGRHVAIGECTFKVIERTVRCDGVNADPETGEQDMDLPALLQEHFPEHGAYLGVYAQVVEGGAIKLGDPVVPLE